MFVATVPLKVAGRQVSPGEPVPEFNSWQETVRRAHLNLGWIKDDGLPTAIHSEPVKTEADTKDGSVSEKRNRRKKNTV